MLVMKLGLRAKSALVLGVCIAVVVVVASLAAWHSLGTIEANLGTAFARNTTQLNKQRILAPVARELALSQQLAVSEITRQWLEDENNAVKRALFFAEAARYRQSFDDHSYFIISAQTRHYFFNDANSKFSAQPRYTLDEKNPNDQWFFNTMKNTRDFNVNVDPDVKLKTTKVWFNVLVQDNGRKIGLTGTGLDLGDFLARFIQSAETGVTPILLNKDGAIQAHPNRKLIDYSSINDKGDGAFDDLSALESRRCGKMRAALLESAKNPDAIPVFWARLDSKRQLCALSFIPELNWFAFTAVDVQAAQVLDQRLWMPLVIGAIILLLLLVGVQFAATERMLLRPLLKLTEAARKVGRGDYALQLPHASRDEMGELTRSFGAMAQQVRTHTDELEGKVRERTRELVAVNEQITAANQKINDSIEYAGLLQNSILPDIGDALPHFVLWLPRDIVGGDFYLYREDENGILLGVVDCAGHGVPGAIMTMLAHALFENACETVSLDDPATILARVDARLRAMAGDEAAPVTTQLDAGLVYLAKREQRGVFCGGKVALYWSDGATVREIKGDRYSLGGKRTPNFTNQLLPEEIASGTYYFASDGFLDQSGGEQGFGFGTTRWHELLKACAVQPIGQQCAEFEATWPLIVARKRNATMLQCWVLIGKAVKGIMDHTDLYLLRETYNQKHILLCFNGPFSQGLIVEIGSALKRHIESEESSAARDVFAIYIEIAQNIQHYSAAHGYEDSDLSATVVISRQQDGRYAISAGNVVEAEDGRKGAHAHRRTGGFGQDATQGAIQRTIAQTARRQCGCWFGLD